MAASGNSVEEWKPLGIRLKHPCQISNLGRLRFRKGAYWMQRIPLSGGRYKAYVRAGVYEDIVIVAEVARIFGEEVARSLPSTHLLVAQIKALNADDRAKAVRERMIPCPECGKKRAKTAFREPGGPCQICRNRKVAKRVCCCCGIRPVAKGMRALCWNCYVAGGETEGYGTDYPVSGLPNSCGLNLREV